MNSRTAIHRGSTALWANDLAKKLMQWKISSASLAALRADLIWFPEPREDHASYCELDRSSQRAIFAVSSQAQRAADYLNGLQPVRC
jgi:antirestriction protein ArdC